MARGRGPRPRGGGRSLQPAPGTDPGHHGQQHHQPADRRGPGLAGVRRGSQPSGDGAAGRSSRGLPADDLRDAGQLPPRGGEARPVHPRRRDRGRLTDRRALRRGCRRLTPATRGMVPGRRGPRRAGAPPPGPTTARRALSPRRAPTSESGARSRHGRRDGDMPRPPALARGPGRPASLAGDSSSRAHPFERARPAGTSAAGHAIPAATTPSEARLPRDGDRPTRAGDCRGGAHALRERRRGRARAGEPRGAVPGQPGPEPQVHRSQRLHRRADRDLSGRCGDRRRRAGWSERARGALRRRAADHLLPAPPEPAVESRPGSLDGLGAQARKADPVQRARPRRRWERVRRHRGRPRAAPDTPLRHHARRRHPPPARHRAHPDRSAGAPAEPGGL